MQVWLGWLIAVALATGCQYGAYFMRDVREPMLGLEVRVDPHVRQRCLIVLMPGMLNLPDAYLDHGFVEDALAASRRCDLVALDAHNGYYRARTLTRRVGEDVLVVAEQRGYEDIWLVGSSMGGMGALLVAQAYPDRVDGVVLFAPWFGDTRLLRSIEAAGGLVAWDGRDARGDQAALWRWLRGYATHPEDMPPLYLGIGDEDGTRLGFELLAAHLPATHHGRAPGGHAWGTWRVMWRRLLDPPPWDRRGETPRIDRSRRR
ncbi:MAG: alpha/beta fold hydrolase [Sandaracinaceae bacterium]|nr:alpha/beta fold hydrolase [Sandaracinaceae bacterium]